MIPALRVPPGAILPAVEIKLRKGWHFDAARRVFVSDRGEEFTPRGQLPRKSRIVQKTPDVQAASRGGRTKLSAAERSLLQYLQVILPKGASPAESASAIKQWPCVEEAALPPEISLPGAMGNKG